MEIIALICLHTPENKKHKAVSYPCMGGGSDKVKGKNTFFLKKAIVRMKQNQKIQRFI